MPDGDGFAPNAFARLEPTRTVAGADLIAAREDDGDAERWAIIRRAVRFTGDESLWDLAD